MSILRRFANTIKAVAVGFGYGKYQKQIDEKVQTTLTKYEDTIKECKNYAKDIFNPITKNTKENSTNQSPIEVNADMVNQHQVAPVGEAPEAPKDDATI